MIAPIMILTLAWTLSGVTNLLGAKVFVADMVQHFAQGLQGFLPMVIFVVAAFLAFATGTSWGTFSIFNPNCNWCIPIWSDDGNFDCILSGRCCLR